MPRSMIIAMHDVIAAQISLVLAILLAHDGRLLPADVTFLVHMAPIIAIVAGACCLIVGLHRHVWSYTSIAELGPIAKAATIAIILVAGIAAVDRAAGPPPNIFIVQWFVFVVLLCGSRLVYRFVRTRSRSSAPAVAARTSVLICGCGPMASVFIRAMQGMLDMGVRVVGIIDDAPDRRGRCLHDVPVLGPLQELDRILAELAVQGIQPRRLLVASAALLAQATSVAESCRSRHSLEVHYLPDIIGLSGAAAAAQTFEGAFTPDRTYFRVRRVAEIIASGLALLALAPIVAAIAIGVLVDLGRPVLFRQVRPGRCMRPFTLYKFRTMGAACRADGTLLVDHERTSALGRFLRRSRLDELPQLYNVLKGDMSCIGPRPMLPQDLPHEVAERVAVRPGITGWAQVNGGHQLTAAEKMALDRWYVRHAGVMLDARILWRTLRMMVLGEEINRLEIEFATSADRHRQRLLVVNRYFYPDECATSQLVTDLIAGLDPERFATTVLTGRQNYVNIGARLPARECFCGAEVRRIGRTGFGRAALPARALDCLAFAVSAFVALITTARPGDVILAKTDPPLLSFIAWLVARLTGARLVNWCQDLFPETAAAMGLSLLEGPFGSALRALRNLSLKGAEVNVVLCDAMATRLAAEGVPQGRVRVIHNWADGAAIKPLPSHDNPLRRAWGLGGKFVLGYSGNLGSVHDVDSLVELMTALKNEPDLLFLFVGAGCGYSPLRAAAAERGIENTAFRPYQARVLLPQSLTAPDMHLVTLRPSFEGLVMPSKVYGALAAGRPVIFIGYPAGSVARIVADGIGLVAAPGAIPRLAAEIRMLRREPARLARMGARARRAYEATYNKDASLRAWTECLYAAAQPAAAPLPQAVAAE